MFTTRLGLALLVSSCVIACWQPETHAQGILRRLRDRISSPPILPPPTPYGGPIINRPGTQYRIPVGQRISPVPGSLRPITSGQIRTNGQIRTSPVIPGVRSSYAPAVTSARRRNGIAGQNTPTPAIGPSGIRQASANEPLPGNLDRRDAESTSKSVLVPFDQQSDRETVRQNATGQDPDERNMASQASIGIRAVPANPGYPAVQVIELLPHADRSGDGLRVGDYIFAIDGVATPNVGALSSEVTKHQPGEQVRLRIGRDRRVSDLDIALVASPDASPSLLPPPRAVAKPELPEPRMLPDSPKIGAVVRDIPGTRGVLITEVTEPSPASIAGLQIDDRIVAVDGKMVADTRGLLSRLSQAATNNDTADLRVVREGTLMDRSLQFQWPSAASDSNEASLNGKTNEPTSTTSPLGGLGAAIGGFFGGGKPSASVKPDEVDPLALEPMINQPSIASDRAPVGAPELRQPTTFGSERDVLELESSSPNRMELPPPTPEPLPPPKAKTESRDDDNASKIRSEIERLRKQLKSLESKLESGDAKPKKP